MLGRVEGMRIGFGRTDVGHSTKQLPWPTIRIGEACQYSAEVAHRLAGRSHPVKAILWMLTDRERCRCECLLGWKASRFYTRQPRSQTLGLDSVSKPRSRRARAVFVRTACLLG